MIERAHTKIQVSQYKASISNKTEIKLIMGQETTWTKRAETTRMEMTRNTKTMVLYNFLTSARIIMRWVLILQFCIFRVTVCIRFSNFERLYTYINL